MTKKQKKLTSELLASTIVDGMLELKAKDIVSLDLRSIPNAVADFFVICHGTSSTQVEAIARSVEKTTHEVLNEDPGHLEGTGNAQWILMDYFDVVVHIFDENSRSYYAIEDLWADAPAKKAGERA